MTSIEIYKVLSSAPPKDEEEIVFNHQKQGIDGKKGEEQHRIS
jgi:hypothetical protein